MKRQMFCTMFALVAIALAQGLLVRQAAAITGGQVDQTNTYSNVGCVVFVPPDGRRRIPSRPRPRRAPCRSAPSAWFAGADLRAANYVNPCVR